MSASAVHYFRFLVHPEPSNDEYGVVDGAWVNCWVRNPVLPEAESQAREMLENAEWSVELVEERELVDDTIISEATRKNVEQARQDGFVAVFHTWPVGAPEE